MGTGTVIRPPRVTESPVRTPRPSEFLRPEQEDARRLRVTVLLAEDPFPPRSGQAVRAIALARSARRAGMDVTFEVVNATSPGLRLEDGFRVHGTEGPPPWRNPIPLYEAFNPPTAIARLAEEPPDIALIADSRAAPTALLLGALGIRVVVDLPAVVEDMLRLTGAGTTDILGIKPVEHLMSREPEGIIVASERDRAVIMKRHAAHPGRVVVFPSPTLHAPVAPNESLGDAVVWLGRASGRANRHALRRLARNILPSLRRLRPGTHVILAGPGTSAYAKGPNVDAIEEVDDIDELLAKARCVVAPLTGDSGSPVKVADALARGVPVVATPDAVVGHADLEGYGTLLGETDDEIVDRILDLMEEPELAFHLGQSGATAYRERRREKDLFSDVADLFERARRQWVGPEQKLARLHELRGRWPETIPEIKDFLESRPHRFGRLGSGVWGGGDF